ncbi:MAG: DUF4157 domain-containing protein [Geminicoccaceae bacterium]|nr:MAG: DUF4157 domain-containing protein [Geminicoccaceae bacterium]
MQRSTSSRQRRPGGGAPIAAHGRSPWQEQASAAPAARQLGNWQRAASQSPASARASTLQRLADQAKPVQAYGGMEEEELLQGRFRGAPVQRAGFEEEEPLQGRLRGAPVQRTRPLGEGGRLPVALQQGLEQLSGMALDDVRVHRGSPHPAEVGALAYAQGQDIHLGPGQERHLPHEAWHAVQQRQGRVPVTASVGGEPLNDDAALEHEADVMGARALEIGGHRR